LGKLILPNELWQLPSLAYFLVNVQSRAKKRSSSTTEYFLMDGHSGVRSLASNTGSVLQSYNYDAFGNLQNFSGTPKTKYLYTGQQFDSPGKMRLDKRG